MDQAPSLLGEASQSAHGDESIDWHTSVKDVYLTLSDYKAPDDAKRDAALRYPAMRTKETLKKHAPSLLRLLSDASMRYR